MEQKDTQTLVDKDTVRAILEWRIKTFFAESKAEQTWCMDNVKPRERRYINAHYKKRSGKKVPQKFLDQLGLFLLESVMTSCETGKYVLPQFKTFTAYICKINDIDLEEQEDKEIFALQLVLMIAYEIVIPLLVREGAFTIAEFVRAIETVAKQEEKEISALLQETDVYEKVMQALMPTKEEYLKNRKILYQEFEQNAETVLKEVEAHVKNFCAGKKYLQYIVKLVEPPMMKILARKMKKEYNILLPYLEQYGQARAQKIYGMDKII